MPNKTDYNNVVKQVAQELGIPEYKVWEVVHSVCKYIAMTIEAGKWEGFYMRFFGKFVVKPKRLEYMQEKLQKMLEKAQEDPLNLTSDE
jgi:hypothetical protein